MKNKVATCAMLVSALLAGVRMGSAQNSFVEQLQSQWEASRKQMVQIAEAMPADKFQFKPTSDVRSFGELITHVAGENMTWLERMAGVAKPGDVDRFNHLKTRPEILKSLADSYAYGAKAIAALNDQKAMESVPFGRRQSPRWAIVIQSIGHAKEHYGNMVTYQRLVGIVPPSTAGAPPPGS